jgi:hypothetical protein
MKDSIKSSLIGIVVSYSMYIIFLFFLYGVLWLIIDNGVTTFLDLDLSNELMYRKTLVLFLSIFGCMISVITYIQLSKILKIESNE